MFNEFFQWDRFITPKVVRIFYYLNLAIVAVMALSGLISAFSAMAYSFISGLLMLIGVCIGAMIGVIVSRIVAELALVAFKIEEHLHAVRVRWEA